MVLGMPTTAMSRPRSSMVRVICRAPRMLPSPPMTNSTSTANRSRVATISSGSWLPRELPRIVPPSLLMSATASRVSSTGLVLPTSVSPRKPLRNPRIRFTR